MIKAKVFQSGNSQALRIPKEYRLNDDEMCIQRLGSALLIFPEKDAWKLFETGLSLISDDFMADGREQPEMQEREDLL